MKHLSACTSVMVGKNASIDGSTMIARNDDTFLQSSLNRKSTRLNSSHP